MQLLGKLIIKSKTKIIKFLNEEDTGRISSIDEQGFPQIIPMNFVFLNDWGLGQVVLWGEDAITNWKSGDCYKITGTVTPHGAVNCGPTERWLANVRGKPKANRVLNLIK